MPADFAKLRTEFSTLHTEATAIIETAASDGRELKPDEKTANDTRFARMQSIKNLPDDSVRFASLALAGDPAATGTLEHPKEAPGRAEFEAANGNSGNLVDGKVKRAEFAKALTQWADTGDMPRQFATITTSTASGALLPKIVDLPIVPIATSFIRDALAAYGQQPVYTDTTANMSVPVLSTTAGGVVSETASTDTENAPDLSESITLNVATYHSGSQWFSGRVLSATGYDLTVETVPTLLGSKEYAVESAMVAGVIADAGITQNVTLSGITSAGLTFQKLSALNRALPRKWDKLKVIVLSNAAFTAAESLVDSQGRPLLTPDAQNQSLLRFQGIPVYRTDYLDPFGVTKTVGFITTLLGFKLRDAGQAKLVRFFNIPTRPDQVGLDAIQYHGFGWAPSSVAKLVTSAS